MGAPSRAPLTGIPDVILIGDDRFPVKSEVAPNEIIPWRRLQRGSIYFTVLLQQSPGPASPSKSHYTSDLFPWQVRHSPAHLS